MTQRWELYKLQPASSSDVLLPPGGALQKCVISGSGLNWADTCSTAQTHDHELNQTPLMCRFLTGLFTCAGKLSHTRIRPLLPLTTCRVSNPPPLIQTSCWIRAYTYLHAIRLVLDEPDGDSCLYLLSGISSNLYSAPPITWCIQAPSEKQLLISLKLRKFYVRDLKVYEPNWTPSCNPALVCSYFLWITAPKLSVHLIYVGYFTVYVKNWRRQMG